MACTYDPKTSTADNRKDLISLGRYRLLSDFVASSLIFLERNHLLRGDLTVDDLREEPLGPWGGVPVMSVIYAHLNRMRRDHDAMHLVTSLPSAPFVHLANLWLEGGTGPVYRGGGRGLAAMADDVRSGLQRFGEVVDDRPTAEEAFVKATMMLDEVDGMVVCAVDVVRSDTRFLDGAVRLMRGRRAVMLPILVVQGRLGSRHGYAAMDDGEIMRDLSDRGWCVRPIEVGLRFESRCYVDLEWAWHGIHDPRCTWGYPVILLKLPRSLGMPPALFTEIDCAVPDLLGRVRADAALFNLFRGWLEAYAPGNLVQPDGSPDPDILELCAPFGQRLAQLRDR